MANPLSKSIYAFYFNGGIREIIPIYPLYAVMFSEHGISPLELSMLFVIWAAVGIVFEVPSGALADRFSRKWLIIASGVFKSLGFLMWFAWQDFWGYALGFVLWGFGSTLRSGAWEAMLHDLLAALDREMEFTKHYGRISALATVGVMFGEAAGGFLIMAGYDTVLLISAAVPLVASFAFFALVQDLPKTEEIYEANYLSILKSGVKEAAENRVILYILLTITLLVVSFGVYDEYSGVTLFEKGFSLSMIAFLGIPIFLAQSIGHFVAHWFERFTLGELLVMIAVASATLVTFPNLSGYWIPAGLTVYFFAFGVASTLFQGYLQKAIEGSARATVTSVVGLGDGVGAIFWFLTFGAMAEARGVVDASLGLGVIAVVMCVLFRLLAWRWRIRLGASG